MCAEVSKVSFGTLYSGRTLKEIPKANKELTKQMHSIQRTIRKEQLHKKENVDIILHYDKKDGFYGVISSKEQGTPMNPAYRCKISLKDKAVETFKTWVNAWDEAYAPNTKKLKY